MTPQVSELDPEMASLLLMGESAQAQGDFPFARQCYEKALELHPHHAGAMLNLGITHVELWAFGPAVEVLDQLETELSREQGDGKLVELRLSGRYNAALSHWYLACGGQGEAERRELCRAVTTARDLALAIPLGLERQDLPADRRHVVEALEGATIAMLQGILVDALSARVEVAACDAKSMDVAPIAVKGGVLRRAREAAPPTWLSRLAAEGWYDIGTVQVLGRALTKAHQRDARTRYNRAVARARLLELSHGPPPRTIVDQALTDLQFAVGHDRSHVRWAARDRLIEPLRAVAPERFADILRDASAVR